MDRIALVDGNHLVNRVCFKGLNLTTSTNIPSGGVYLFLKSLLYIKENYGNPIVVFDGGHAEFRKSLLPGYKVKEKKEQTVEPNPESTEVRLAETFSLAFGLLPKLLPMLGVPTLRIDGEEADDILYLLTKIYAEKFPSAIISAVSEDEDYHQFMTLSENVRIIQPIKKLEFDRATFMKTYGFPVQYHTIFKALQGDDSDKIPGIRGIAEGTAGKIVAQLTQPTLECLYTWSYGSNNSLNQKVLLNWDTVKRNYHLIDLRNIALTESEVQTCLDNAMVHALPDLNKVTEIFTRLEFKSLSKWISLIS